MKIYFDELHGRGKEHVHEITPWVYPTIPWTGNSDYPPGPASPGDPMQWLQGYRSKGFIHKLFRKEGRTYEVTLYFHPTELKNWLRSYIETNPEKALALLAEMLPEVAKKLKDKG